MNERWRPVVGYEGLYEVSDRGRVRSLRFGRWGTRHRMLRGWTHDGYRYVELSRRPGSTAMRVHCLVLEAFIGPRPPGLYGCHNDGNPGNNELGNLRWDTPTSNLFDRVKHGRDHNAVKTHCPRQHELVAPNLAPSFIEDRSAWLPRVQACAWRQQHPQAAGSAGDRCAGSRRSGLRRPNARRDWPHCRAGI
jgi:hypothetical protein